MSIEVHSGPDGEKIGDLPAGTLVRDADDDLAMIVLVRDADNTDTHGLVYLDGIGTAIAFKDNPNFARVHVVTDGTRVVIS